MALRVMTVELDPASDPIRGRITDDQGTRPFSGWLELAVALQVLADGSDDHADR